jgi:hypothetical protein
VSDYNILSGSFSFDNGESWVGLSSWQAATGGDSHSSVLPSLAGLFTNTGSGDYHLAVASPLIDAGAATVNSLAAPTADLDNEPRPDGSGYDVGCYEFNPALPAIVAKNPAAGASGVVVPAVSCTFNHGVTSGSIVFVVKDSGGTSVAGSTSYDSGSFIATWTPASPLAVSSLFTASVSGATDSGSHVMAGTVSWSFTTAPAPAVVAVSPTSGAAFIGATTAPTVQYDVPIAMAPTVTLTPSGGSPVSGSLSYNAGTDTFTFTPSSSLSASTVYTLVSSGAVDAAGNVQPSPFSSTFTTAAAAAETLFGDATPGTDDHDQGAVNGASYIGVRFKSSVAGQVLSLGFYKGANNAGTHVGWLYSVDQTTGDVGTQLATVTFSGETSSGWQWQNLGSPITLTSNTIYMAVVQCPNQHMSLDNSYFTVDRSNGSHLTGVADLSGSSGPPNGTMTTHSYDVANASAQAAANWYVDVRFQS